MKRLVVALLVLAAMMLGTYVFARRVLGSDLVRSALEQQLAERLGQPVHIGSATASLFPNVAVDLHDVSIGAPVAAELGRMKIVTGLRGLFSRTVVDAEVVVSDSRVAVPQALALIPAASEAAPGTSRPPALTIRSIRVITIRNVTLAAGKHALLVDADASIEGDRLDIARLTARAAATSLRASGVLSSIVRIEGTLQAAADPLDLDELIALASAMTSDAGGAALKPRATSDAAPPSRTTSGAIPMHVVVKMTAPSGQFAAYRFRDLATTVDLVPGRLTLAPLSVKVFGGAFSGRIEADTRRQVPRLRLTGRLDDADVSEVMNATGSPGSLTGRLAATMNVTGEGAEAQTLIKTADGTLDAAVTNGRLPGLDMVRTIVLAFGKPSGAPPPGSGSSFTRLGGTFDLTRGTLASNDLSLASRDFDLHGRGTLQMSSGTVAARADVVLSEELTSQAGVDLRRYAQQDGHVIVPATINGNLADPSVSLDIAAAGRRALGNELKRRVTSLFEGLFKKKK